MFSKAVIERYFVAEKQAGLLFFIVGLLLIVAAIVFFAALRTHFYKGLAIPAILFGIVFSIIGYTVYKRSDNDRVRNVYAFDMNPSQLKQDELPRMEKVMKSFKTYRLIELLLTAAGVALFVYFRNDPAKALWKGLGLGLFLLGLLALTVDTIAERRGAVYTKGLKEFSMK